MSLKGFQRIRATCDVTFQKPLTAKPAPPPVVEPLEDRLFLHGSHGHDHPGTLHEPHRKKNRRHGHTFQPPIVVPVCTAQPIYGPHHTSPGHPNDGVMGTDDSHYFAETGDEHHFAWQDQNTATPDVIDLFYDFRTENGFANLITAAQQTLAETALQEWGNATGGRLSFTRSTTAARANIINIGTGNLAALNATSGANGILGLGGGTFTHNANHTITFGAAWMDSAETWDTTIGNGNVPGTFDYFTVLAQEIGHALGLGHTDNVPGDDMMDGNYDGEVAAYSLNDVAHVRSLYNVLTINGTANADTISASVSGGVLTVTVNGVGTAYTASLIDGFFVEGHAGDDVVTFGATTTVPATILGGDGNDSITGGGGSDSIFGGAANDTLDGGLGADTVHADGGSDTYTVSAGADAVNVTGGGTMAVSAAAFASGSSLNVTSGTVTLSADAGSTSNYSLAVTLNGAAAAVVFNASQHLASLVINAGTATLATGGNKLLVPQTFSIAKSGGVYQGKLNLTDNDMIIRHSTNTAAINTASAVFDMIAASRNASPQWSGNGISTSAAVGYTGLASSRNYYNTGGGGGTILSSFGGESVNVNAVLVKFTYNGDADFSGFIDGIDYFKIDWGDANNLTGYQNGDFNYSGGPPSTADYNRIDEAVANQGSPL